MVKDGIVEETVEEMTLTITPDSDDDSEDEDLIDEDDRQIIDRALERLTETDPQNTSTCTNPGVRATLCSSELLELPAPSVDLLFGPIPTYYV